jgi:hypothetical protein
MNRLRATTAARVVLIQDVPVPGSYAMPACVAAHLDHVTACTFPIKTAYSFPARHRQLAADATRSGYTVVDPAPWICTSSACPAIVGNILTYRDDTHLTATFSAWLWPYAAPLLSTTSTGSTASTASTPATGS